MRFEFNPQGEMSQCGDLPGSQRNEGQHTFSFQKEMRKLGNQKDKPERKEGEMTTKVSSLQSGTLTQCMIERRSLFIVCTRSWLYRHCWGDSAALRPTPADESNQERR